MQRCFQWRRSNHGRNAWLLLALLLLLTTAPSLVAQEPAATPAGPRKLRRYRAVIYGLPEFDCVSVDDLGVLLTNPTGAANSAETPDVRKFSRILDLKLERRFDMDREFHHWINQARAGKAEPKDGVVILLDNNDAAVVRFRFYQAVPKRWEINIPPMDEKQGFVTETVTLRVQDMVMEY